MSDLIVSVQVTHAGEIFPFDYLRKWIKVTTDSKTPADATGCSHYKSCYFCCHHISVRSFSSLPSIYNMFTLFLMSIVFTNIKKRNSQISKGYRFRWQKVYDILSSWMILNAFIFRRRGFIFYSFFFTFYFLSRIKYTSCTSSAERVLKL